MGILAEDERESECRTGQTQWARDDTTGKRAKAKSARRDRLILYPKGFNYTYSFTKFPVPQTASL